MGQKPADEEELFPRSRPGASDGDGPHGSKRRDDQAAEKLPAAKRKKGGNEHAKVVTGDNKGDEGPLNGLATSAQAVRRAPRLRHADLVEGTLLLAAVREVLDEELVLNLPYNIVGFVSRAQAMEDVNASEGEPPPKLSKLYSPGQLVAAVVLGVVDGGKVGRQRVELSLRPALANAGLDAENIVAQMSLPAVVQDEEEHVLRLNFGIQGLQGVMKKSEVANLPTVPIPGCIIQVAVQSINASTGTVRCVAKAVESMPNTPRKLETLKAGFLVHGRVDKVLADKEEAQSTASGLVVTFCGYMVGIVHRHHHALSRGGAPLIKNKQHVTARILAVVPGAGIAVHLTLLPHILDWSPKVDAFSGMTIGDRFDGEVIEHGRRYGCLVNCRPQASDDPKKAPIPGFCPASRLADKDSEQVPDDMAPGTTFTCRALAYNYLDGVVIVTRRPYDLKEDTLVSVAELTPGQLVVGVVVRLSEFGAFVKLSEYVTGLVHLRHLTDVPLATVPKRIRVDTKLKCRVLRIFPERRQLNLTAKKLLVKDDFQFVNFDQARRNMLVTGYVSKVQSYGAIVSFYNDMHGLLPAKEMEADVAPAVGMAVKCRISYVNRKMRRITLSLDLEGGKTPAEAGADVAWERADPLQKHKPGPWPGEIAGEVRATLCTNDGVFVRFKPKAPPGGVGSGAGQGAPLRGYIPIAHLSDDLDDAQVRHRHLAERLGGVADSCEVQAADLEGINARAEELAEEGVVLTRRFNPRRSTMEEENKDLPFVVLVSLKPSMRLASEEGNFVKEFEDLQESRAYAGYVKELREFGALVSVGSWRLSGLAPKGNIADHFVATPSDELTQGQTVRVVVTKIDLDKQRFTADLRPEGAAPPVELVLRREVGAPVNMVVREVGTLQVLCKAAGGVRGHVHATHFLDLSGEELKEGDALMPLEGVRKGATLQARILHVSLRQPLKGKKVCHLELTCRPSLLKDGLAPNEYTASMVRWLNLKRGQEVAAVVAEVRKGGLLLEVMPKLRGRVVPLDASKELHVVQALTKHFKVGQVLKARVLRVKAAQKRLDLTLHTGKVSAKLAKGSQLLARLVKVQDVLGPGVVATFQLPAGRHGFVHITELFDFWTEFPLKKLKPKTLYEVSVLDAEVAGTTRVELSLRASKVHGRAEAPSEQRPVEARDLQKGQKVCGYVVNASEKGVFVALSRSLSAYIPLRDLSDEKVPREKVAQLYPPGLLVREAKVTDVDLEQKRVRLSLRKGGSSVKVTREQISVGDVVSGYVRNFEKYGFFMRLDDSEVDGLVHSSQISDNASVSLESYKVGDKVPRAKVLKIENGKLSLGVKASLFEGEALEDGDEAEDNEDDCDAEEPPQPAAVNVKEATAVDSDEEAPWERAAAASIPSSGDAAFVFADFQANLATLSEEDKEAGEEDEKEAEKPSKKQKKAAKMAEAEEVRKREAENAEGLWAKDPRSVEDFERLLLTEGDTSIVWIRYMAFHLKLSELEKARQVAERAVKHVGFSEAQERFNAWVAYMNLECTFGTDESADAVFQRAASHNDAKQVHLQLARIHERNKKPDLAVKVYETTCKKFPQSKQVWMAFLTFLYQQADLEGGRKTLPKCLAALPRAKHAMVVSKAAILEYAHGSSERGRSIFEGLLDSYPKRTDLWSVYLDAHIRAHTPPKVAEPDLQEVRSLMERCCTMTLKAVKMRFFFKRWLDFEASWGDEESQESVRAKARAYVESQAA